MTTRHADMAKRLAERMKANTSLNTSAKIDVAEIFKKARRKPRL